MKRKETNSRKPRTIELSLQDVEILQRKVVVNNKYCHKVHVPLKWELGKKVLLVMLK